MKVIEKDLHYGWGLDWTIWFVLLGGVYWVYRNTVRDLLFIASTVISIMTVYCNVLFDVFRIHDIGGFFIAGFSIVFVTYFTVKYLVKLNKRWKKESLYSENG